MTIVAIFCI